MLTIKLDAAVKKGRINKNIYGHFAEHLGRCIYEGIWVGKDSPISNTRGIRNDVAEALRKMGIPVLRWPGGCFADEYHWKDGVGPENSRKKMINTHWGGVIENNHFGTHEFMELCEMLECEPYICGNAGSGTVQEMQEWVEYLTFDGESPMSVWRKQNGREQPWKLKYFGVGNENWGCGGFMRVEYYADVYRRYQTYVRNFGDNRIYKIACGGYDDNYHWMEVMMREAGSFMDGLSIHYYTMPGVWNSKGSATEFSEGDWFLTMKKTLLMDNYITGHSAIMDKYDPEKKVKLIIDEWGTWFDAEPGTNPGFLYQQNTLRDALVAGINLNIFNSHCDRVDMANIAQLVNVLQAVILTEGDKIVLTPTYHVFSMYQVHQNAELLSLEVDSPLYSFRGESVPQVSASASMDSMNRIHITICNLDPNDSIDILLDLNGYSASKISGKLLTSEDMQTHNTFEMPENIHPVEFKDISSSEGSIKAVLPAKSIVVLQIEASHSVLRPQTEEAERIPKYCTQCRK